MAADKLVFDSGRIASAAGEVRTHNSNLGSTLQRALDEVKKLSAWEGNAGSTTLKKFQTLAQKYFDTMKKDVESYAIFLEKAVKDYGSTEQKITGEAAQSTGSFFS